MLWSRGTSQEIRLDFSFVAFFGQYSTTKIEMNSEEIIRAEESQTFHQKFGLISQRFEAAKLPASQIVVNSLSMPGWEQTKWGLGPTAPAASRGRAPGLYLKFYACG